LQGRSLAGAAAVTEVVEIIAFSIWAKTTLASVRKAAKRGLAAAMEAAAVLATTAEAALVVMAETASSLAVAVEAAVHQTVLATAATAALVLCLLVDRRAIQAATEPHQVARVARQTSLARFPVRAIVASLAAAVAAAALMRQAQRVAVA
jgi:hypothetical protein